MKKRKTEKTFLYGFVLVLTLLISVYACKPSREDNDLQNEHANSYLTEEELANYAAWEKEKEQGNYIKDHEDLIRQANDKIESLEEAIDDLSPEKQVKARKDIERLKARQEEFENKLNELKQANQYNWSVLNKEVDQLADSLELSIEEIDKNVEFGSI